MQVSLKKLALQRFQAKIGYFLCYLGSIHGVKQILAHPWFGKNSYKSFLEKKVAPPITYDSVGRIDLDKHDDKHKKDVDEIQRVQKSDILRFKREMKNFYYDFRGLTDESHTSAAKQNFEKSMMRTSSSKRFKTTFTRNSNQNSLKTALRKSS